MPDLRSSAAASSTPDRRPDPNREEGMARIVEVDHPLMLEDYAEVAMLAPAVRDLREEAAVLRSGLQGRKIWMISSTEQGGGVAEMLPAQVSMLREVGFEVDWVVMEPEQEDFFPLTKRLHNLIHGAGDADLGPAERELYQSVSEQTAERIGRLVGPRDILVVHDPQPLGAGAILKERTGNPAVWRCHIGLDEDLPQTQAAWSFLEPYSLAYDHTIFSVPEYIPWFLAGRSSIIHPAIDPLSPKNRELSVQKLVAILCEAGLMHPRGPLLDPLFAASAKRLQTDGGWAPASVPDDLGLLFHPMVTQVSRWDRLKGFAPLLEGFRLLKAGEIEASLDAAKRRTIAATRLVLAGPDPDAVADDPEAGEVLEELRGIYLRLPEALQREIAIVALPMESLEQNALAVNALQRSSSVVVQNSLREGFGLTATEAMWKAVGVMVSAAAGLRQQVRDGIDGRIVEDPADPREIASMLALMLTHQEQRETWGRNARRRVYENFLVFPQLCRWMETLVRLVHQR
jgi:trehalose synthase